MRCFPPLARPGESRPPQTRRFRDRASAGWKCRHNHTAGVFAASVRVEGVAGPSPHVQELPPVVGRDGVDDPAARPCGTSSDRIPVLIAPRRAAPDHACEARAHETAMTERRWPRSAHRLPPAWVRARARGRQATRRRSHRAGGEPPVPRELRAMPEPQDRIVCDVTAGAVLPSPRVPPPLPWRDRLSDSVLTAEPGIQAQVFALNPRIAADASGLRPCREASSRPRLRGPLRSAISVEASARTEQRGQRVVRPLPSIVVLSKRARRAAAPHVVDPAAR